MKINELIELHDTTYQTLVWRLAEKDFNSVDDLCILSPESEEEISSALFKLARKHYEGEHFLLKFIDDDLDNAHKKILQERYNQFEINREMKNDWHKDSLQSMRG